MISCSKQLVALLGLVTLGCAAGNTARQGDLEKAQPALVLHGGTVVDVMDGRLLPHHAVVIVGNRIRAVGPMASVTIPAGARRVDVRGKYLIPGLWDMHVHTGAIDAGWRGPDRPRARVSDRPQPGDADILYPYFILKGVTGVRELGTSTPIDSLLRWRTEVLAGTRMGPRALISGRYLIQDPTPMSYGATRGEAMVAIVDSMQKSGADQVKIHADWPRDVYFALARETRRAGIRLVGHMVEGVTPAEMTDSGQKSFEHVTTQLCDSVGTTGEFQCAAIAERMRKHNAWAMPGAGGHLARRLCRQGESPSEDVFRSCRLTPASPAEPWTVLPLIAGTDITFGLWPPAKLMPEFKQSVLDVDPVQTQLAQLVGGGMTPLAALQTATLNPALYLEGTDSLGTIAAGKLADIVVLRGNPLEDIWQTANIEAVIANGRYFDRAALDAIARELEQDAMARTVKAAADSAQRSATGP